VRNELRAKLSDAAGDGVREPGPTKLTPTRVDDAGMATAGSDETGTAAVWRSPWRILGSFLVCVAGLLAVAWAFPESAWAWSLWIGIGLAAGSIAGRGTLMWLVWVGLATFYALAAILGVTRLGPFWVVSAIVQAVLMSAAFAVGTALGWRRDPWATARTAWRGMRLAWRRLAAGAIVVALLGVVGYVGYAGVVGSAEVVNSSAASTACETPGTRFGWDYEAINYDKADDLRLVAENPDMRDCSSQGATAGSEVVSPDGVPIAGWYIPAASAIGPTGPTVLIVHGGKANKSGVLKYAPPFHESYNLVLLDLRNSGRSGGADSTWGLREQSDLRAMIDWLVRAKSPAWIGVMGNSNGAAAALAEAGDDVRVRALVLDSMHASVSAQVGNILETENGHPSWPGSWAIIAGVSLRIGADVTSVDPVRTIARVGDRPVLLVHGSADLVDRPSESAERNLHAALEAGVPVGLEICPGAGHGKVVDTCPEEWARWAVSLMAAAQGEGSHA
jgi:pimeloyl-ACP methyl ester carboxylesterase